MKGVITIAITNASLPAKKRILTVCVRLFLEKGYKKATLAELNENLREIYIESYTQREVSDYIFHATAKDLHQIFRAYQPELTERDFYDMEIGSASIMRGYMAHPCDEELSLEKKLRLFLTMTLRVYNVPQEETERVIAFVAGLDIRRIAEQVMQKLFQMLAMHYEFSLDGMAEATTTD